MRVLIGGGASLPQPDPGQGNPLAQGLAKFFSRYPDSIFGFVGYLLSLIVILLL